MRTRTRTSITADPSGGAISEFYRHPPRMAGAAAFEVRIKRRCAVFGLIVSGRHGCGESQERAMSHQPPKENKKKAQHTAKEKKTIKQQKKHAGDAVPLIKH
jgi:hypothetical protein